MKIFIVNLKDSHERRAKLKVQLDVLGLEYEFIEAVDGRKFSASELEAASNKLSYAFLPGEVGCALSHQKIYKKMVVENIDAALILEDDVTISADIKELLNQIDITTNKPTTILLSRVNKYFKAPLKRYSDKYSLHKTQHGTTTHSYIINKAGATSLLAGLYPVWMVADKWSLFEDLSMISVFSIMPPPVILSEQANISTINDIKGNEEVNSKKIRIWNELMKQRPIKAKFKHRYRRAIAPIFNTVVNQGKG